MTLIFSSWIFSRLSTPTLLVFSWCFWIRVVWLPLRRIATKTALQLGANIFHSKKQKSQRFQSILSLFLASFLGFYLAPVNPLVCIWCDLLLCHPLFWRFNWVKISCDLLQGDHAITSGQSHLMDFWYAKSRPSAPSARAVWCLESTKHNRFDFKRFVIGLEMPVSRKLPNVASLELFKTTKVVTGKKGLDTKRKRWGTLLFPSVLMRIQLAASCFLLSAVWRWTPCWRNDGGWFLRVKKPTNRCLESLILRRTSNNNKSIEKFEEM